MEAEGLPVIAATVAAGALVMRWLGRRGGDPASSNNPLAPAADVVDASARLAASLLGATVRTSGRVLEGAGTAVVLAGAGVQAAGRLAQPRRAES